MPERKRFFPLMPSLTVSDQRSNFCREIVTKICTLYMFENFQLFQVHAFVRKLSEEPTTLSWDKMKVASTIGGAERLHWPSMSVTHSLFQEPILSQLWSLALQSSIGSLVSCVCLISFHWPDLTQCQLSWYSYMGDFIALWPKSCHLLTKQSRHVQLWKMIFPPMFT